MDVPTSREVGRQYRVLQQTLSMHADLRDEYGWKAKAAKVILLACSVVFASTVFASDTLYETLRARPDTARITLGIASVVAFFFSLLLLVVDWEGLSAVHGKAATAWSQVLAQFRESRNEDGSWSDAKRLELSSAYWEASRNTARIPARRFSSLKARYLRKVAVSRFQDEFPACPRLLILLYLVLRDTGRAAKAVRTSEASAATESQPREPVDAKDTSQDNNWSIPDSQGERDQRRFRK